MLGKKTLRELIGMAVSMGCKNLADQSNVYCTDIGQSMLLENLLEGVLSYDAAELLTLDSVHKSLDNILNRRKSSAKRFQLIVNMVTVAPTSSLSPPTFTCRFFEVTSKLYGFSLR